MRKLFLLTVVILSCSAAKAQTPVKESLLPWLSNLTPLPQTVFEVKTKCYNATQGVYDNSAIAGPLPKKTGETIQQIGSTNPANPAMPDTAGIADVQKMTPEQQQAWAMQYAMKQQAAASASMKLPSTAETALFNEHAQLVTKQAAFVDSLNIQFDRLLKENDAKQKHFDQQKQEMINLCPKVNGGEGDGGPEFSCVKKAEANYQEWEASWGAEWFKKVASLIAAKKNEMNALFGNGESLLASNGYFLNASNPSYTQDAAAIQLLELNSITALLFVIDKTWQVGAAIDQNIRLSHERCGEKY
jgi:hypothetical protein